MNSETNENSTLFLNENARFNSQNSALSTNQAGKVCPDRTIFHKKEKIKIHVLCRSDSYTKKALVFWVTPVSSGPPVTPVKPYPLPPQYVPCPDGCGGPTKKCVKNSTIVDGIFGAKDSWKVKGGPIFETEISKTEICCDSDKQTFTNAEKTYNSKKNKATQDFVKQVNQDINKKNSEFQIKETSRITQSDAQKIAGKNACDVTFRFPGASNQWRKSGSSKNCAKQPDPFTISVEHGPVTASKEVCGSTTKSSSVGLGNLILKN